MADKELSSITAAGALDGTETVHVVQSGNSRRATTADIARSGVQVNTYGLSDVDTSEEVVIDLSNCFRAKIHIKASLDASDRPELYVSDDGGTTIQNSAVYNLFYLASNGTAFDQNRTLLKDFGTANNSDDHYAILNFYGLNNASKLLFELFRGSSNPGAGDFFSGWVDTVLEYDALVLKAPGSTSFDAVDITVFRY